MATNSAVRINYYFTAGEAGVCKRSTDGEFSGFVDEEFRSIIQHIFRYHRLDDFFYNVGPNFLARDIFFVLSCDYNRVDSLRFPVDIFDRNLGFSIRSEVVKDFLLSYFR